MSAETKVDAATRQPRGVTYDPVRKGGVEYKNPPPGPQPGDDEEFEEQVYSKLTEDGKKEIPDSTPLEPPLGYSSGPSLADFVKRMIHGQLSQIADDQGFDTAEEADDFDIEDDPLDPLTPYEAHFLPPSAPVAPKAEPAEEGGAGGGEGSQNSPSPPPATTPNEKT